MSNPTQPPYVNSASGSAMAFLTVMVILVALGFGARFMVSSPPIDADRAAERYKALDSIRAAEDAALSTAGWVDQDKQIVRLPIEVAIQQTVSAWQNPQQARAALIARGEKAAAPAPKSPPKPSAFE